MLDEAEHEVGDEGLGEVFVHCGKAEERQHEKKRLVCVGALHSATDNVQVQINIHALQR